MNKKVIQILDIFPLESDDSGLITIDKSEIGTGKAYPREQASRKGAGQRLKL